MGDARQEWVAAVIAALAGAGTSAKSVAAQITAGHSAAVLAEFLDAPNSRTLCAIVTESSALSPQVQLQPALDVAAPADLQIVFSKADTAALTPSNIASKVVTATYGPSPLLALLQTLRSVYSPALGGKDGASVPPALQALVAQLEAGTGSPHLTPGGGDGGLDGGGVFQELRFWENADRSASSAAVRVCLEKLRPALEVFLAKETDFTAAADEAEVIYEALHDLWELNVGGKWAYPSARMGKLLDCLGSLLMSFARRKLGDGPALWAPEATDAVENVQLALQLMRAWEQHVRNVMYDWTTGNSARSWDQQPFIDTRVAEFVERLDEVLDTLTLRAELRLSLATEAVTASVVDAAFERFGATPALLVSEGSSALWRAAKQRLEAALTPADALMAARLKELLSGRIIPALSAAVKALGNRAAGHGASTAQPFQIFQEVLRHRSLLARPNVAVHLSAEQDAIGKLAAEYVGHVAAEMGRPEVAAAAGAEGDAGDASSRLLRVIIWLRQTSQKVLAAGRAVRALLSAAAPPPTLQEALRRVDAVHEALLAEEQVKCGEWLEGTQARMAAVKGWQSAQLLQVDGSDGRGCIKAHFNRELVVLLTEIRQLKCMNVKVPAALDREVKVAERFYHHGVMLQQVANFYNSIGSQILECHKPCLLQYAKALEDLILNPKDRQNRPITWDNAAALGNYMVAVEKVQCELVEKNRALRSKHQYIGDRLALLARLDLVKQRQKWHSVVDSVRQVFVKSEADFPRELQGAWRLHWDQQLHKVLSAQFRRDVRALDEALPAVAVRLVFRGRSLQLEPCLEEIRAKHYQEQLGGLLSFPAGVQGFGAAAATKGSAFYTSVLDAFSSEVAWCYAAAEGGLFAQLRKVVDSYGDWVALGTLDDMDDFVDSQIQDAEGYASNFEMLKTATRDLGRYVPNEETVGCYKIDLTPMKAAVEEQIRRLRDALVGSLRRRTNAEQEQLMQFVKLAHELLAKEATSIADIGDSRQRAAGIMRQVPGMRDLRKAIDDKSKTLRAMARGQGGPALESCEGDMASIAAEWDGLMDRLSKNELRLQQQKATLGGQISSNITKFEQKVVAFEARWLEVKPKGTPSGGADGLMLQLEEAREQMREMAAEAEQIKNEAVMFDLEVPAFGSLEAIGRDVESTAAAWGLYKAFSEERDAMASVTWNEIRTQLHRVDDFVARWTKECDKAEGADTALKLTLLKEINSYKRCLPHLSTLRGTNWEPKHWAQLFQLLSIPGKPTADTVTLRQLLSQADAISASADQIKVLNAQAQAEAVTRKALDELDLWGLQRKFVLTEGQAVSGKVVLVKEWREMMTEVGDQQSLTHSLLQSPCFALFKDQIEGWEKRLAVLQEALSLMSDVQRKWVYLEPIFARGSLPEQGSRFRAVDDAFKAQMARIAADPLLRSLADVPNVDGAFASMLNQLEVCQKALFQYLESKRSLFPRFYFLGDDDLLEILGQASNPAVIQMHLKKLFAGIHSVELDGGSISHMCSMHQESVKLAANVQVRETVEAWLSELTAGMAATLQQAFESSAATRDAKRFVTVPSQVICLEEVTKFTRDAEAAIAKGGLSQLKDAVDAALKEFTSHDYSKHKLAQLKVKAVVLDVIHHRDVCAALLDGQVTSTSDWLWHKQLRFYPDAASGVRVAMAEAAFSYSWEYQGNAPKLVHTPLTDKCYLTLTQGMALGYGGCPYGPAGTGKTESVKALGQALGRQVLVFNCDEEFDFRGMGRIFLGLCKCGAWGCFDEFNRLEEDVLSAVSQQIQVIQGGLKQGLKQIQFMDAQCDLNMNTGIFVTLNPAGKGYGGRSKLPDNLKQLFRSIAMTAPDNELIAEVMLLSEGFGDAKAIGRKLVALLALSGQLLSSQRHYDWGLRALKTILGIAGKMLREGLAAGGRASLSPDDEALIILSAVRATKLPTLTFDDLLRFSDLMGDMWPNVAVKDVSNEELSGALHAAVEARQLQLEPEQVEKAQQLHLACEQRIGVIIVGPSGSGKSTLWQLLGDAYKALGSPLRIYKFNPKAMPRQLLLGHVDADTREWYEGVLTACARKVAREPLQQRSWIVCDGDVDPEWIESLNSVLDDNRLMTMPSGERIQFANNVNFIFECHSLEFASPATVSRCGMIYTSDESVDVQRSLAKFLRENDLESKAGFKEWVDKYFRRALLWVLSQAPAVAMSKVGIINNALSQLRDVKDERDFARGVARGFGANLPAAERAAFLRELETWSGEGGMWGVSPHEDPLSILRTMSPAGMAAFAGAAGQVVETEELRTHLAIVAPWLRNKEPFILCGPLGCGKASLMRAALAALPGARVAELACNTQTLAKHVIEKLMQICGKPVTKGDRKVLRPRDGSSLLLLLRDVNLPRPDQYGTVQLTSFLQQCIVHGGFYDDNLDFIHVDDVQIVALMSPSATLGRQALSTRVTGVMRVLSMDYPSDASMRQIFAAQAATVLRGTGAQNAAWQTPDAATRLVDVMLTMHDKYRVAFPADEHLQYCVTPNDVHDWLDAVQHYDWTDPTNLLGHVVAHEAVRIYGDRLAGTEHRAKFDLLLASTLLPHFPGARVAGDVVYSTLGVAAEDRLQGKASSQVLSKWSLDDFKQMVADKLKRYEREFKTLDMLLVPECLHCLARFDRVLARPGGVLLLNGFCGVGRRTAVNLVAYAQHLELVSPSCGAAYGLKHFRSFLKEVLLKAGVKGRPVCLFLEDHHLRDATFLELVNSLLASGEVPGLFSAQELDKELKDLEASKAGDASAASSSAYAFFLQQVKSKLKVVVSLNPENADYRMTLQSNPALLTRGSVQWMEAWTAESMEAIAQHICHDGTAAADVGDTSTIPGRLADMHRAAVAQRLATPGHFFVLARQYRTIFAAKRQHLLDQLAFLQGGLGKLAESEAMVDALSKDAQQQRGKLKDAQGAVDAAMGRIERALQDAALRRAEVEQLSRQLDVEQKDVAARKLTVGEELKDVEPLISKARSAVGNLKSDNLNEIRSLKAPPAAIRDVLEAVLRLMGQSDTSWNSMKRFLSLKGVKEQIINFDATTVTPLVRAEVQRLIAEKADSFEPERIFRVSVAAAPMAEWVLANLRYSEVLQQIAPLTREMERLEASLSAGTARLQECEAELVELDRSKGELQVDFQRKNEEATLLKLNLQQAEATLTTASILLSKLSGEKGTWSQQASALKASLQQLPALAALSAAFITYLPGEPELVRSTVTTQWMALENVSSYDFRAFMGTESEALSWKLEGLPGDNLSRENATAITHSLLVPLLVDPAAHATQWLKAHMAKASLNLAVTTLHDPRFSTTLELALRFGKVLVIQEVDALEPILYPILRRDLELQGTGWAVQVGDKRVDYHDSFRLFLATRNPAPALPPDARALLCVANFTVTRSGLESQLLAATLQHEQPELEQQRSALLHKEESMTVELSELNKRLLTSLSEAKGDILNNRDLMLSLDETKLKASEIAAALETSALVHVDLVRKRNVYAGVAAVAASMFFALADLPALNPMYHFSLAAFMRLFASALQSSPRPADVQLRLAAIVPEVARTVYEYAARSLFNADRLTFAVHFARRVFAERDGVRLFPDSEWDVFMANAADGAPTARAAAKAPPWVPELLCAKFQAMAAALPDVVSKSNLQESGVWSQWMQQSNPEQLPSGVAPQLTPFQATLLVQAFRPDRLRSALQDLARTLLGVSSIAPPPPSMAVLSSEASSAAPILFITTPADPSQELLEFARSEVGGDAYFEVAMGQGQTERALQLLHSCAAQGTWLCLKNIHLVAAWLPRLERELYALTPHPNFRLWLTSEGHAKFPSSLLEMALKVAVESPPGIKANLQRTFATWPPDFVAGPPPLRAQLLLLLAWFHAVVQERRSFIPQGWSQFYEFSGADLMSGVEVVRRACGAPGAPRWPVLLGLLEHAIYGGRVDNAADARVLQTYLHRFFNRRVLEGQEKLLGTSLVAPTGGHAEIQQLLRSLPDADSPALFGLAANVERSAQEAASARVVAGLRLLSVSRDAAAGYDRDRWARELAPLLKCWDGLVAGAGTLVSDARRLGRSASAASGKADESQARDPLAAFMMVEGRLAIALVAALDDTLSSLRSVLAGTAPLASGPFKDGARLLLDCVPQQWDALWEGPETPLAYVQAVMSRAKGLTQMRQAVAAGKLLHSDVPLQHFFHPCTFINTLRQATARQLGASMDSLELCNSWNPADLSSQSPVLATVSGLVLEGAKFDGKVLEMVTASDSTAVLKPVTLAWLPARSVSGGKAASADSVMRIAVYASSSRQRHLFDLKFAVPSVAFSQQVTLSGAAVFLMT